MATAKKHKKGKVIAHSSSKSSGKSNKIVFGSDDEAGISSGDMNSDGSEYNVSYQIMQKTLEAKLDHCPKCPPKELLCLVDKHSKHRKVIVEMLRSWVLALVHIFFFILAA